jgi:autotransporter translocation and assembly factor TamB
LALRLLVGGLVLLALLAGGELYLAQGGLSGPVRNLLVTRLGDALHTTVAVDRVRLSMFPPSVTVRGLTLGPAAGPSGSGFGGGTVEEVRVRVSPWSLLTGGLGALDVRARNPDLAFTLAPAAPGAPAAALPAAGGWEALGAHRLLVDGGRVRVTRGDMVVVAEGIHLAGAPDVTLRSYQLDLTGAAVTVNDAPLLSHTALSATLETDRLRIRNAAFDSEAGRLELAGEVRFEDREAGKDRPGPYIALRTTYQGTAAGALALARRLGAPGIELSGTIGAEGRLYGPPQGLAWDGEVTGADLALAADPRRVETLEARLRVAAGRLEVVHIKAQAKGGEVRGDGGVDLAPPYTYEARVRADDVPLAWLTGRDLTLGRLSGEAHLVGAAGAPPRGTFQWRYRGGGAAIPDDEDAPLMDRLAVRLTEGSGSGRLEPDGTQVHAFSARTAGTHVDGDVTVAAGHALEGTVTVEAADFAEIGALFHLEYVHGKADADARLSGTLADYRLRGQVHLADGSVRALKVARLVGDVVLTPGRLAFRNVRVGGDGAMRLAGEVALPRRGEAHHFLAATLAASVHRVPMAQLAGVVHNGAPLELDLPVSGKLNLVVHPDGTLFVWSRVHAGAGTLYGQPVAEAQARIWIDRDALALSDAAIRLPVPEGSEPPAAADVVGSAAPAAPVGPLVTADGTLWWDGGRYDVSARTDSLPVAAVTRVREAVPFLMGRLTGTAHLTGDFSDPDLRVDGTLAGVRFHDDPVGQAVIHLALSRWQLRVHGRLLAPAGQDGAARFVLYTHLKSPNGFQVAVRYDGADAMPWVRGLLPAVETLVGTQLGPDWGLSVSGSLAAAGTFRNGPEQLLLIARDARLVTGGRSARLEGPARVTLEDGRVRIAGVVLRAEGLRLGVEGTLVPRERFDLAVTGEAGSGWLAHVRPAYGFAAGTASLDLTLTGPWDAPVLAGTVHPSGLAVAPPGLEVAGVSFGLTGEITVRGPLADPARGDVTAHLAPFAFVIRGNTLTAADARVSARDGTFRLAPVELTGELGQVRVTGGWTEGQTVALKAVGNADLTVLARQLPGISKADGRAAVSGEMKGPWDAPAIRAGVNIDNARVRIDPLDQTLELTTMSLLYSDGRFVLDTLEGRLGGGAVVAEGSVDRSTGDVNAAVTLDGYTMHPFAGLTGVLDGELLLTGRLPAATLSGDLHVRQAVYDRRMQWTTLVVENVARGGAEVAKSVPFGEVRLAVRVYGADDIRVDTNVANLVLDIDLALGGTVADPGLAGRVDVRQGEVEFRGHTFTIVSASVDFLDPSRIAPYLDVLARTTVDHALPDDPLRTEPIEIDLGLTGPADRIQLTLTSRPDLPQSDLLSLLAVGLTSDELAQAGAGVGAGEATYLATGALQGQVEEQLHRFAGIDRFQVEPFYAEGSSTSSTGGSARLTVGKKLFDGKGMVIYSTTMDAAVQPLIQLSYSLSARTSVVVEQDELGRTGGELRFRIRFR